MKLHHWLFVLSGVLFLVGCGTLDSFFGTDSSGADLPGPSTAETVGGWLSAFLPWAAAVASAAAGVYQKIRRSSAALESKKYKDAALSLIEGIEDVWKFLDANGDGKITKDELMRFLESRQNQYGSGPMIDLLRGLIK